MKFYSQAIVLTVFVISSCSQHNAKLTSDQDDVQVANEDKAQIERIIRQMYKWHETDSSKNDMRMLTDSKDSIYIGVDLEKHKLRLDELRKTNFFSEEYISNDYKIAETIDRKIRNKEYGDEWLVGDLPPFGSDVNAWCKCQDYPDNNPWDKIAIKFVSLDDKNSTITWTWGDSQWSKDFEYKIRLTKVGETWKISYLEGFDFETFTQ